MREIINKQIQTREIDIAAIKIDIKSRDDIPQLLLGIQYIYKHKGTREKLLATLEKLIVTDIDRNNGRPGMSLWRIFVLGMLRINLNWDYDRLHEMANNHRTIRQILGHVGIDEDHYYHLQTIKDNLRLFTPEILDEINRIVVNSGHKLLKKKMKN